MPHIHTEPGQHDHTVSLYIIRVDTDEPKLMLHTHKKLGKIMQFGGHIELDETPWQSVMHELVEETGYDISQTKILQPKDRIKSKTGQVHPLPLVYGTHPYDKDHSHTDVSYLLVVSSDPLHEIGVDESQDIRWYTKKGISEIPEDLVFENVLEAVAYAFAKIDDPNWERVSPDSFA